MAINEQNPSYRLNEAFTGMMEVFDASGSHNISRGRSIELSRTAIERYMPVSGIYIDRAPSIYSKAPYSLTQRANNNMKLIVPVGDYGNGWAEKLLEGCTQLVNSTGEKNNNELDDHIADLSEKRGTLIKNYTYHGVESIGDLSGPIERTFLEGQGQTTLYAAGLLTMYSVPGYENNPLGLLDDLVKDGVFSRLSLAVPPNVMEGMAISGTVLKAPAVVKRDYASKFYVRGDIIRHWSENREMYDKSTGGSPLDKPGCPLGRKLLGAANSGVDLGVKFLADTVRGDRPQANQDLGWTEKPREVNRREYFNDSY